MEEETRREVEDAIREHLEETLGIVPELDESEVPLALHQHLRFAELFGVGDDGIRAEVIDLIPIAYAEWMFSQFSGPLLPLLFEWREELDEKGHDGGIEFLALSRLQDVLEGLGRRMSQQR